MAQDEKIEDCETSPIDPSEIKKSLSRKFFTIRTTIGMWAFFAIIAELLDISKWKVFRIIHAFFISWNKLLHEFSSYLNSLIDFQFFDAQQINIILVLTTIYMPALTIFANSMNKHNINNGISFLGKWVDFTIYLLLFSYFFYLIVRRILDASTYEKISDLEYFSNIILPYILLSILCIYVGCRKFYFYRRSIIISLILITSIEIVYFLPFVGDAASGWADSVLETCADRSDDCAADRSSG